MEWKWRAADGAESPAKLDQIQVWAKHGRVKPETYIFNPITNTWLYAKDVQELRAHWPTPPTIGDTPVKRETAGRSLCGLAVALFLFSIVLGMLGMGKALSMLLVGGAFIFGVIGAVFLALRK